MAPNSIQTRLARTQRKYAAGRLRRLVHFPSQMARRRRAGTSHKYLCIFEYVQYSTVECTLELRLPVVFTAVELRQSDHIKAKNIDKSE